MNILIISYWFEPCQAIGAKRWYQYYWALSKIQNINITVLSGNWQGKKIQQKEIVYLGEKIYYAPPLSKESKPSLLDCIKHPSFIIRSLDFSIFSQWYGHAKKWIESSQVKYDIVIASYGPIGTILLGAKAKKKYDAKLIVDLRDLISLQGQKYKLPFIHQIDQLIDKFSNRATDAFLTVSPTCKKKAEQFYRKPVHLLYNGIFDIKKIKTSKVCLGNKINIFYAGTLGLTRNPKHIVNLLNEHVESHPEYEIVIYFASQDDPFSYIEKDSIKNIKINWLGYISKDKLYQLYSKAHALLLLEDQSEKGSENLTGKLFEYMTQSKPILASCNPASDIAKVLTTSKVGMIVDSLSTLKLFLDKTFYFDMEGISPFSNSFQATRLVSFLNHMLGEREKVEIF